jgi:hypothetical protein
VTKSHDHFDLAQAVRVPLVLPTIPAMPAQAKNNKPTHPKKKPETDAEQIARLSADLKREREKNGKLMSM